MQYGLGRPYLARSLLLYRNRLFASGSTDSEPGAVATGYEASTPNQKRKALLARISQVQIRPVATAPGSELVDPRKPSTPTILPTREESQE